MSGENVAGMVVELAMESDDYKKQIQAIQREMKVVDSAFKATGYTAKDFGNSIDGLKANLERCNTMLNLQAKTVSLYEQKVTHAQKELDRTVNTHLELKNAINHAASALSEAENIYGNNSEEANKLREKLDELTKEYEKNEELIRNSQKALDNSTITYNNAIAKMKDFEKQIRQTEDAIEGYEKKVEGAENAVESFNRDAAEMESVNVNSTKSVNEMTIAMGNLAAEITEKVVEAFGELIQYSFEYTEQMTKFEAQTGFNIESLQKWDAILQMTGGNIDTLAGSLADFQERIYDTTQGTGDGAEVFKALNIEVTNLDGSLRNTEDVFDEMINKLQNMEDETLKNSYATMMLSTGGEELARVLNMTNEELQEMKGNIKVLSGDEINDIQELNETWKALKQEMSVEFMQLLATYSDDWAESLNMVADALNGIMQIVNGLEPVLRSVKKVTDWLPSNVVTRKVSEVLGSVGEFFEGTEQKSKESMKSVMDSVEDTAEVSKDAMEEVADSVADSMQGAEQSVKESLGIINNALDDYYKDERSKYEKSLEDQYGDSKKARIKIALLMEEYDKQIAQQKQKDIETYSRLYLGDVEEYGRAEERKTKKLLEESNKRIQQFNKERQASKNTYSEVSNSKSNSRYPSYDTGTQYHLGGLAMVHKDELVELPRGSKVKTKSQTQQFLTETNNTTNNSPIVIQNINLQSNNAEDFLKELKDRARRG